MKKILLTIFLLGAVVHLFAQDTILVAGASPDLYIYHAVQPKENFYSIGRAFNVSPKEIARINKLNLQVGLKKFQIIKIPLTSANFTQSADPGDKGMPLLHKVQKGETLYRVSVINNKVPVKKLEQWNHLKGSKVSPGQYLTVGWLKKAGTTPDVDALKESVAGIPDIPGQASDTTIPSTAAVAKEATAPAPVTTKEDHGFLYDVIASERSKRSKTAKKPAPAIVAESVSDDVTTAHPETIKSSVPKVTTPVIVKDTVKKEKQPGQNDFSKMLSRVSRESDKKPSLSLPPVVGTSKPAQESSAQTPVKSVEENAAASQDVLGTPSNESTSANDTTNNAESGEAASPFESQYMRETDNGLNIIREKGAAAWFKSNITSTSKRYYALHTTAPRGTILKVTNPANGRFVYVKVLDTIPKLGDNYNLIIKISDAAMDDLGVINARFWCELTYGK